MTRTIAALLAAATIAGVAAPADAQTKYFARERIVGMPKASMPTTTYSPTYSDSYGACVNGSQAKTITGCTASDGTPARISDCASSPQSKDPISCTAPKQCGTLSANNTNTGPNTYHSITSKPSTVEAAQDVCESARQSWGQGMCYWNLNGTMYYQSGGTLAYNQFPGDGRYAYCK